MPVTEGNSIQMLAACQGIGYFLTLLDVFYDLP